MMTRPEHMEAVFQTASECAANGALRLRIRGSCMSPCMSDGDTVSVRHARFILPGDVVVFRTGHAFVAHRVLGVVIHAWRLGILTRGDHCDRHDGIVYLDRVVGRVEAPVRLVERVRSAARFVTAVVERLFR